MAKQTKTSEKHNKVIALIAHGKHLRMIEAKEMDWQQIFTGEGIGNGKQKKDVVMAFYLNASDDVIMKWEKPKEAMRHINRMSDVAYIASQQNGTAPVEVADSIEEDLPW